MKLYLDHSFFNCTLHRTPTFYLGLIFGALQTTVFIGLFFPILCPLHVCCYAMLWRERRYLNLNIHTYVVINGSALWNLDFLGGASAHWMISLFVLFDLITVSLQRCWDYETKYKNSQCVRFWGQIRSWITWPGHFYMNRRK